MRITGLRVVVVAGLFCLSARVPVLGQTATSSASTAAKPAAATHPNEAAAIESTGQLPQRVDKYFAAVWGVDNLAVKLVESGEIARFTYRVVDAERAKTLNDKKVEPSLIDPVAGVSLVVPSLEKVGQLRQSSTPEVGKSYWMAFSNKGRRVKKGDRVNVVIGQFKVEGLIVE